MKSRVLFIYLFIWSVAKKHCFIRRDGWALPFSWSHSLWGLSQKTLWNSVKLVGVCVYVRDEMLHLQYAKQAHTYGPTTHKQLKPTFWIRCESKWTRSWERRGERQISSAYHYMIVLFLTSSASRWWPWSSEGEGTNTFTNWSFHL
jgi:hypothetical protein